MYFCIRDDDTSFFTSPEELEAVYGEITRFGPVSLAIVPHCRAGTSKGVPERWRGRWTVHHVHENQRLVDYLRQRIAEGRFEAMLHGYHHDEPNGMPEFAGGGTDLQWKVKEGRRYLEDLLGTTIRVFVPPHNALRRDGLRAIAAAGLHLAGVAGFRSGWSPISRRNWVIWSRVRRWREQGPGVPWILDLDDHRELPCRSITPSSPLRQSEAAFETAVKHRGAFCAATHYWEHAAPSIYRGDPDVRGHLRRLVELALTQPGMMWRSVGDVITEGTVIA